MFKPIDKSFYKDKSGKKLIAVELAPPVDSDDEKLMDAAHILEKAVLMFLHSLILRQDEQGQIQFLWQKRFIKKQG